MNADWYLGIAVGIGVGSLALNWGVPLAYIIGLQLLIGFVGVLNSSVWKGVKIA